VKATLISIATDTIPLAPRFLRTGFAMARLALIAALVAAAPAFGQVSECPGFRIIATDLRDAQMAEYCRYATAERAKVEAFWGPAWTDLIRIRVDANYRISRALVPAYLGNRGFMEMPLQRVTGKNGALLHEIAHIYAPHDNRFLAEGLAVYLQAKMGGNTALPNNGEPLARLARRHLPSSEVMAKLNEVHTPVPLGRVMDDMTAYLLAGSFVEWLIESKGLDRFKVLYNETYESAYGKPFAELEREWRGQLK
jgi:hypothetical protein